MWTLRPSPSRQRARRRRTFRLSLPSAGCAVGAVGAAWLARGLFLPLTATLLPVAPPAPLPAVLSQDSCAGGSMQVVAHQDDDLLFQNPDVLHDVQAGRCVRTVFLTAGDAGHSVAYWTGRESGSRAAYARMAGVSDSWTASTLTVAGKTLRLETLDQAPSISLVFLRLPDGRRVGSGNAVHNYESLMRLWTGDTPSISAIDGSNTFTDASLRATLTALLADTRATTVRTQDWTIGFRQGDNADHTATALYVRAADQGYTSAHTLSAYGGYPTWTRAADVVGHDLEEKKAAFLSYAAHDPQLCLDAWCADKLVASLRLGRQYVTATESTGNVARGDGVVATASSQAFRQGPEKAVDGYALGYPTARSKEWATSNGTVGSWLQLDFPVATAVNGVVLHDRPTLGDHITGATLEFSDGSTVETGPLPNNSSGLTLEFPLRTTTSVRLTVTSVSGTTRNVGLAEIEVYGDMPAP